MLDARKKATPPPIPCAARAYRSFCRFSIVRSLRCADASFPATFREVHIDYPPFSHTKQANELEVFIAFVNKHQATLEQFSTPTHNTALKLALANCPQLTTFCIGGPLTNPMPPDQMNVLCALLAQRTHLTSLEAECIVPVPQLCNVLRNGQLDALWFFCGTFDLLCD